jgi:two-component system chemotaxis response regulator CheY
MGMSELPGHISQQGIMIVDDNRHMRALLFSILRALGARRIKEVADGESAMNEIESFQPDIVLVDWHMEPMDGITLVRNIRHSSSEEIRHVVIIMLTGHAEVERIREARDSGAHEFMVKPVSANMLDARLRAITDNPRPFIKTDEFFGPDRRRKNFGPPKDQPERRINATAAGSDRSSELSPEEALVS